MNRQRIAGGQVSETIYRVSDDIQHTSPDLSTGRHRNRRSGADSLHSPAQSVRGIHGDTTHGVFTDMLLDLDHQRSSAISMVDFE